MPRLSALFEEIALRTDLVAHHAFDNGHDNGPYFNFTFGTDNAGSLWQAIRELIYQAPTHRAHMAKASMAMCSSESGWESYVQLFHWDPEVPVVSATDL
jgi:hypothetical protein